MAFMQLSEKTKRFWAFVVSFAYPAVVLMGASSYGNKILELGFSEGQRSFFVGSLIVIPILILIYFNIKFARQTPRSKVAVSVITGKDECLSLVLMVLLLLMPVALFGFIEPQSKNLYWSIFNIPSLVIIGSCCFAFMLILNGGHALRWLYQNKSDVLVRYNHHLKAGSAYSFAGMLGTGIGLVQFATELMELDAVFRASGIAVLTSLYGLVFFAHHLLCRMWLYAHDEDAPSLIDLNGIFVAVGPAFVCVCVMVVWFAHHLSPESSGAFGLLGDLFIAYGVTDWDLGVETIYHQLAPIVVGLSIFVIASFFAVSLFLRRKPMVRSIHESTWVEFIFTMGAIYLISLLALSGFAFNTAGAGLAFVSIGIVALVFFTAIGMCHVFLNFQGRWADVGVISVKQGSPHLLNYFHAPYFWNLMAIAAALMGSGSIYQSGYIFLGIVVLFLVGQSQFTKNRLERIIGVQTEQLQRDKLALQTLDNQKTQFFQTISHELRTPLTLIMSPLERRLEVNPGQEELLIASSNAKRLLRLVNQLLDFQKASAGRFELNLRPRSLGALVLRCADYFRSAASGRSIRFSVTQNGDLIEKSKAVVVAQLDSDGFEKVVMNFLSNALKYTPPGGEIELGFLVRDDKVRVFVRDSGPGIPAEAHESLFEIFTQVDGSTTREFEGTGIGLALCKDLSEGMGGAVGVESQVGQGSTFWADFPQAFEEPEDEFQSASDKTWMVAGDETRLEEADEEQSDMGAEDIDLILVVDDNPDMRRMVKASTLDMGYRVVTAEDGQAGLDAAKEHMPDLIVSDWMMPNMSGPEMVRAIRADEVLRGIPVVMLTAKSDEESKLVGTGVGADAFLGKPFNKVELSTTIRNLLQLKSGEKEIKRLNEYLTESVCKRYLPAELVQEILDGKLSMEQPAQLRQVTILFSDLKGFTATSERLGPEGISEILNEYLTVMNEVIFEHGGTIDKFIGDAIMVIFGAPKDMDDSEQAERAAQCALAMNQGMAELSSRWEKFDASHLCMRIGIHQGPAVVGNFGSQRRSDYTCIGPTVNFAARIESAAKPGSVYVSSAVKAHLLDAGYEPAGEFDLKGLDQSQTLYRLIGV